MVLTRSVSRKTRTTNTTGSGDGAASAKETTQQTSWTNTLVPDQETGSPRLLLDLPAEVIVLIAKCCLKHGVITGMASLVALRMTCRALRGIVTPVLLSRLFLRTYAGLNAFLKHLEDHPHQSKLVCDLVVGGTGSGLVDSQVYTDEQGNLSIKDEYAPPQRLAMFSKMANHFQHLKTLQVRNGTWAQTRSDLMIPKQIDPSCCLPAFETLIFSDFEIYVYMEELLPFWLSPRLKVFIVHAWNLDFSEESEEALAKRFENHPKNLKPVEYVNLSIELKIGEVAAQTLVAIRTAKHFAVNTQQEEEISGNLIMNAYAPYLEGLDISGLEWDFELDDNSFRRLKQYPKLKTLVVTGSCLESICEGNVEIPVKLEQLRAHGYDNQVDERDMCLKLASWIRKTRSRYSNLRYIEVNLVICSVGSIYHPWSSERLELQSLCDEVGIKVKIFGNHRNEKGVTTELLEKDIRQLQRSTELQDHHLMGWRNFVER